MIPTGIWNLGKKHIQYTPEMVLSFVLAITNFKNWKDRLAFVEQRHPELKGRLTVKNIKERSSREGWFRAAKQMKENALKQAIEEAGIRKASLTANVIDAELTMAEDLNSERERLTEALKISLPGSKEYSNIVAALEKVQKLVGALSETDRMREMQSLRDRADASLDLLNRKGELALKSANPNNMIGDGAIIMTEENFEIEDETL